jgi:hypothetical protein
VLDHMNKMSSWQFCKALFIITNYLIVYLSLSLQKSLLIFNSSIIYSSWFAKNSSVIIAGLGLIFYRN